MEGSYPSSTISSSDTTAASLEKVASHIRMPLTEENLRQHHLEMSEDPAAGEQKGMQRTAQIKAALKSLDITGDPPLPDYLADKVISSFKCTYGAVHQTTSATAQRPSSSRQGCSKSVASEQG
jgi:hypothetical protein